MVATNTNPAFSAAGRGVPTGSVAGVAVGAIVTVAAGGLDGSAVGEAGTVSG